MGGTGAGGAGWEGQGRDRRVGKERRRHEYAETIARVTRTSTLY